MDFKNETALGEGERDGELSDENMGRNGFSTSVPSSFKGAKIKSVAMRFESTEAAR